MQGVKAAESTEVKIPDLTIRVREYYLSIIVNLLRENYIKFGPKDGSLRELVYTDFQDCAVDIEYECFARSQMNTAYHKNIVKETEQLRKVSENGEFSSKMKNYVAVKPLTLWSKRAKMEIRNLSSAEATITREPGALCEIDSIFDCKEPTNCLDHILGSTLLSNDLFRMKTRPPRNVSPTETIMKEEPDEQVDNHSALTNADIVSPITTKEKASPSSTTVQGELSSPTSKIVEMEPAGQASTVVEGEEKAGQSSTIVQAELSSPTRRIVEMEPANLTFETNSNHSTELDEEFRMKIRELQNISPANTIIKEDETESNNIKSELFQTQTQHLGNVSSALSSAEATTTIREPSALCGTDSIFDCKEPTNCLDHILGTTLLGSDLFRMKTRPPRNVSPTETIMKEEPDEQVDNHSAFTNADIVSPITTKEKASPSSTIVQGELSSPTSTIVEMEPAGQASTVVEGEEKAGQSSTIVQAELSSPTRRIVEMEPANLTFETNSNHSTELDKEFFDNLSVISISSGTSSPEHRDIYRSPQQSTSKNNCKIGNIRLPVSPESKVKEQQDDEDSDDDYGWKYPAPPKVHRQPKVEPNKYSDIPSLNAAIHEFNTDYQNAVDLNDIETYKQKLFSAIDETIAIESKKRVAELNKTEKEKKLKGTRSFMASNEPSKDKITNKCGVNARRSTMESKEEKSAVAELVKKSLKPYYKQGRIQPENLFKPIAWRICEAFYDRFADENRIKKYVDGLFEKVGSINSLRDLKLSEVKRGH